MQQIINKIKDNAKENFVPIVRASTLQTLVNLAKERNAERILEIGTATGYSALNLLANTTASITTIEKNEERFTEALANFEMAGVRQRVEAICGDAQKVLEELAQKGEKFDFVFLDGPKGQYIRYFPPIKKLLSSGGVLFADNVGLLGLVENSQKVTHKNRTMVRNMQSFLDAISHDEEFQTQIFDIDDGYLIAEKK